jgi:AcrR family transcriptional regulator
MAPVVASAIQPDGRHRPERREQILWAAVRLFAEQGFDATGMDQIGAAVGMSGPGVYRHYASKQAILDEAMRLSAREVFTTFSSALAEAEGPDEAIEALVGRFVAGIHRWPGFITVLYREREHLSEQARAELDVAYRDYLEVWRNSIGQLRPDLTAHEARLVIAATLEMSLTFVQFATNLDEDRRDELLADMMRGVLTVPTRSSSAPALPPEHG